MDSTHGPRVRPSPFWAGGLLGLVLVVFGCRAAAPATAPAPWQRVEVTRPCMGTTFRVVLYARDPEAGRAVAEGALDVAAALDACLSDYDPESELSRFARTSDGTAPGPWTDLSPDLAVLLEAAADWAERSDGAFDITVGPLVRLWRRARRQGAPPSPERITAALASVDPGAIQLDPGGQRARLLKADMRLDLGGLAKGYALDRMLGFLEARAYRHVLLDGGGDLLLGEPPPDAEGWRVELEGFGERALLAPTSRLAVATSGDLEQYVEFDGARYSHLVDPRTGEALRERRLVTVLAPDAATADALASAVSVLGAEAGLRLLESLPWVQGRILTLDGEHPRDSRTTGFPETLSSAPPDPAPRPAQRTAP